MLVVTFYEDSSSRLSSFVAEGHAGWADAGEDIVCAAASALLQAVWLGLERHAGIAVAAERDAGKLAVGWPASARDRADVAAIAGTARLALEQIATQFPHHVTVRIATET